MRKFLFIALLSCLCSACCRQESIYHRYRHFDQYRWGTSDTMHFFIQPEPHLVEKCPDGAIAYYHFQIDRHHLKDYPYQNLMVAIETSNDSLSHTDTIDIWQKENLPIPCPFELHTDKFPFTVKIYHLMQDEYLPNLHRIGLEVTIQ